jgi:pimeloyl-ACP methyl ester carboxylesterase
VALCLLAVFGLLAANTVILNAQTRAAAPRDGGQIIETGLVPANVKIEGEGPPIVMLHGFSEAIDWFDGIAPGLAKKNKVIRIDLIGHGGTAAPAAGYTMEQQAANVAAVLEKLGVDKFTLIAHSMGGIVATAFIEANPDRVERLVLLDTPPQSETHFKFGTRLALTPVIGQLVMRLNTNASIRKQMEQVFTPGFPVPEQFVADFRQLTYTAFRDSHDDNVQFNTQRPVHERLAELKPPPPLLVIYGAEDQEVAPASEQLYAKVPGARIEKVDNAGHGVMVQQPAKVLELIEPFVAGQN